MKAPKSVLRCLAATCRAIYPVVLALAGILPTGAQEPSSTTLEQLKGLDLEQLMQVKVETVYGASLFAQKTTEAPASITVITAEEIKLYGYRTLADILRSLQGFNVSYDRDHSYVGVRGVGLGDFNSRILLLVDGHRMNNNLNDGAFFGTDFILDVDLIDRVEVIRGPGSVLYGNNAFFGVINVITRKAGQVNGAEVSGEYAGFETYKGRVTVGKSFTNGPALLLSGSYYDSEGPDRLFFKEFNTPAQNNGVAQNMDGEWFGSLFGSMSYGDFNLESGFIRREKIDPTAQNFTTFNDARSRSQDARTYLDLKFTHEFPGVFDVMARLYYDRSDSKIGYPIGDPVASAFFQEVQRGQWWGSEVQLTKRLWQKHILAVGAEYRDDFRQEDRIFDSNTTYTDNHTNRQSYGVFMQGDFALRNNLHFNGGIRFDQYGDFDPSYSPRLGLIYQPFEKSTLKALYGTAFRAPSFLEISDKRFQLRPEQIASYELVYEQGIGQHLSSSLSGFYNQLDHLILFQSGSFANVDADARGMELALQGNWATGLRGRASYTLEKTENRSGGPDFPDSPEHLLKLNVSVPVLRDKIFASLECQFTSSRHTVYSTLDGLTVVGQDTPSFGVLNVTLFSQNIVKNLELSASLYNVLDNSYADPSSRSHQQDQILQNGRSFRLKLTYRF
jgi:outer membrane receptor for ferrienterochelin and colicins